MKDDSQKYLSEQGAVEEVFHSENLIKGLEYYLSIIGIIKQTGENPHRVSQHQAKCYVS